MTDERWCSWCVEGHDSRVAREECREAARGRAYYTSDGVRIEIGLRVLTHEMEWGTVIEIAAHEGDYGRPNDVWHRVKYDADTKYVRGGSEGTFNKERLTTRKPRMW